MAFESEDKLYSSSSVNVRSEPNTDSSIITTISPGEQIGTVIASYTESDGLWYSVELPSGLSATSGWVKDADYLRNTPTSASAPKKSSTSTTPDDKKKGFNKPWGWIGTGLVAVIVTYALWPKHKK